jgi:AraC-like DNA-binding protein
MHENPQTMWSLDSLAEVAAMSRSTFANRFKKVVGVSPAEYLTDWRISLAKKQMGQGRAVKHMAAGLGYANASALSRVFAQRTGMSPREWLKQTHESKD